MKDFINGLQHIGVPTGDIEKTIVFYQDLGFTLDMRKKDENHNVAFLSIGNLTIETYQAPITERTGAVDHIAMDVSDVEKVFEIAQQKGYTLLDKSIVTLPFFENGVRYFMIEGPNKERLEFSQKL